MTALQRVGKQVQFSSVFRLSSAVLRYGGGRRAAASVLAVHKLARGQVRKCKQQALLEDRRSED